MLQDGITVTPRQYTITMVCPLCHKPIDLNQTGVTICLHCGAAFTIKPAPPENHGASHTIGPQETK